MCVSGVCSFDSMGRRLVSRSTLRKRVHFKMEEIGKGSKGGFEFIKVDSLSKAIGTSEPALRFLIALLIGNLILFVSFLFPAPIPFFCRQDNLCRPLLPVGCLANDTFVPCLIVLP